MSFAIYVLSASLHNTFPSFLKESRNVLELVVRCETRNIRRWPVVNDNS